MTMAVNEAVTNAAEHAYSGSPCGCGQLRRRSELPRRAGSLTVAVEDRRPRGLPDPAPGPLSVRGRGIQLMRALADEVSIDTPSAGPRARLTWPFMHYRTKN